MGIMTGCGSAKEKEERKKGKKTERQGTGGQGKHNPPLRAQSCAPFGVCSASLCSARCL